MIACTRASYRLASGTYSDVAPRSYCGIPNCYNPPGGGSYLLMRLPSGTSGSPMSASGADIVLVARNENEAGLVAGLIVFSVRTIARAYGIKASAEALAMLKHASSVNDTTPSDLTCRLCAKNGYRPRDNFWSAARQRDVRSRSCSAGANGRYPAGGPICRTRPDEAAKKSRKPRPCGRGFACVRHDCC
jgi:hypothetical protein